jgi:hypothetical protein
MAQSHDGSLIDDDELGASFDRADLPEGEARLVIHEDGVTTVIQGDTETVEQRFKEQRAADLDTTVEGLDEAIEEHPLPSSDEGVVRAEEFYDKDSS